MPCACVGAVRGFTDVDTQPELGLLCRTIGADALSNGLRNDLAALAETPEQGGGDINVVLASHDAEINALPQRDCTATLTASSCQSLAERRPDVAQTVFIENKMEFVHKLGLASRDNG